nr:hypothetical protein [uncultured Shinella sp.]
MDNGYPDFREAFRSAPVICLADSAPRDGTPIAARNDRGEMHIVHLRTAANLEAGDEPYWATYATDEAFEFRDSIPSPLALAQILAIYE